MKHVFYDALANTFKILAILIIIAAITYLSFIGFWIVFDSIYGFI